MLDITIVNYLLNELKYSIECFKKKNPKLDVTEIVYAQVILEEYVKVADTTEYEEICKVTRPPRSIPSGQIGPSKAMKQYAEMEELKNDMRIDRVIAIGKELDKNQDVPYFNLPTDMLCHCD